MSFRELLAPVVEEIANRWGFFELRFVDLSRPIVWPNEGTVGLSLFDQPLTLEEVALHLDRPGLETAAEGLVFPLWVDQNDLPQWRASLRSLFYLLAQENPRLLGYVESRSWNRPRTPDRPFEEALSLSQHFLDRTYRDEFLVREKKPLVADMRRSRRNSLASVDSADGMPTVLLLDASSQIASHLLGFNGTPLRGVTRHPESFQNPDYRDCPIPAEGALRSLLLRAAPEGLEQVVWCNSGTEAWEKALYLAQRKFPEKGRRCVCFKGSFHGRSLLSLFSSWNPSKRLPFQLEGFETLWAEFPEDKEPHLPKTAAPDWLALWGSAALADFAPPEVDPTEDPLLAAEVSSLLQVRELIAGGEVCAVSLEPMQCEGGDRYGSARFFQTLRVLTHAFGVALIFDEVQTAFGLGGPMLWSSLFDLKDSSGRPMSPDFITLAKKCQVGAVLSSVPDPHPTSAHAASFLRGYINASSVNPRALTDLGNEMRRRLFELAERYPMISWPRAQGLAFAFDMPDAEHANNFVNQRFYHGFMVYIAGEKTLRFRVQYATREADLQAIFAAIEASLTHLEQHGPGKLPERFEHHWGVEEAPPHPVPESFEDLEATDWAEVLRWYAELPVERASELAELLEPEPEEAFPALHRAGRLTWLEFLRYMASRRAVTIRTLTAENWDQYSRSIMELEESIYEPARVDDEEFLRAAVEAPGSIAAVGLKGDRVMGFYISTPLELVAEVRGPHDDPDRGAGTHLYSADLLVDPTQRGQGLGLRLKRRQLLRAREAGYRGIKSRNRVDTTQAMTAINLSYGAIEEQYFERDYGDEQAPCCYLNSPLVERVVPELVYSSGVESPTGGLLAPEAWAEWDLAAVNKNSLCNWWTPNMTRYVEWLRSVAPLNHLYLASGRDEAVDKLIKLLIFKRKGAQVMVSFEGSFWGASTAAARSLSDPSFGTYFPWIHLPYPYQVGDPFAGLEDPLTPAEEECAGRLKEILDERAESLLGVAVEPVQQLTGRRLAVRFLRKLRALCDEAGVPLVMNESASWAYRGSRELFYCQATGVVPDALTFFAGGQLGQVLVNDEYFIAQPLMMISTWDGDELSCLRLREQVRMLTAYRDDPRLLELDRLVGENGDTYRGSGRLYGHPELRTAAALDGEERLLFCPMNRIDEGWEELERALSQRMEKEGAL